MTANKKPTKKKPAKKRTGRKPIPKGLSAKKKPKKPVKRTAVVKGANLPVPVIPQDSVAKGNGLTHISLPEPLEETRHHVGAGGRPTGYRPELCEYVERVCMLTNCTDKELAEILKISEATLNAWKAKYPQLLESIANGKLHADSLVAKKLFNRAVGMRVKKIHFSAYEGQVTATDYYEDILPDPKCMSLWLRNRQGKNWKEVIAPAAISGGIFNINIHRELHPDDQKGLDARLAAAKSLVVSEQ